MGDRQMQDNRSLPNGIEQQLTRRRVLGVGGTLLAAGGGLGLSTRDATAAEVSMGELDVSGDSATVDEPPSEILVSVSGEYRVEGPSPPEQSRTVLQVRVGDTSDDLDTGVYLDSPAEGSYSHSVDLYDHRAVERGSLIPQEVGETVEVPLRVRVILLAVTDGSIQAETYAEDNATLTLTLDGLELSVGGSGSVSIPA